MYKIVSEFTISKYRVLMLDEINVVKPYRKYSIDGIIYEPVPINDMKNCIAIEECGKSLVGEIVEFIE